MVETECIPSQDLKRKIENDTIKKYFIQELNRYNYSPIGTKHFSPW
jgi:hypothetical protein